MSDPAAAREPHDPGRQGGMAACRAKLRFSLRQLLGLTAVVAGVAALVPLVPFEVWLYLMLLAGWTLAAVLLPLVGFAAVVLLVRAAGLLLHLVALLARRRDSD